MENVAALAKSRDVTLIEATSNSMHRESACHGNSLALYPQEDIRGSEAGSISAAYGQDRILWSRELCRGAISQPATAGRTI